MNDAIVKVADIEQMARDDFARGRKRDEHNMNWHALALPTWQAEWDRCAARAVIAKAQLNLGMATGRAAGGNGQP